MMMTLSRAHLDAIGFFRLGLASGLVDKQAVIAWADQQIQQSLIPAIELIELSLSGKLPHSQLIRLLSGFHPDLDYNLPVKLIFARAWTMLKNDPTMSSEIIYCLRLLNAEAFLLPEIRSDILGLKKHQEQLERGSISVSQFFDYLSAVFSQYSIYEAQAGELANPK